jgi:hypothetical protein
MATDGCSAKGTTFTGLVPNETAQVRSLFDQFSEHVLRWIKALSAGGPLTQGIKFRKHSD